MDVIIIRHAHAGDRDPKQWPNDDLRPISSKGRERQLDASRAMCEREISFEHLLTSPLVRAVQTAEIVGQVYGLPEPARATPVLGHDCTPQTVVGLLDTFAPDARVALVGHEPALSQVASALVSDHEKFDLKKSGVIGIRFSGKAKLGAGELLYHLKPSKSKGLKEA